MRRRSDNGCIECGFGINNWDMGINKNFAIPQVGEAARLQIRAEFFDISNHTQFSGIGRSVNQPATSGILATGLCFQC